MLDGVRRSHARLLETVRVLDDTTARQPSLLPDWNVAMVVTHLARQADSQTQAAEAALHGEVRKRYADWQERDAGIDAGRDRTAAELLADLTDAIERWETLFSTVPEDATGHVLSADGERENLVDLPFNRWREVEVHHADLGLAFTYRDWDIEYVRAELTSVMRGLEARTDLRTFVAWLLERTDAPAAIGPWTWTPR